MSTQLHGFYEWTTNRSYSTHVNAVLLEVWEISGEGWRFNASDGSHYLGFNKGFRTMDEACEAAIAFAESIRWHSAGPLAEPTHPHHPQPYQEEDVRTVNGQDL
jgi:hypothetical protein